MTNMPSRDDVASYLRDRRNWGRWGTDDERGAINMITPQTIHTPQPQRAHTPLTVTHISIWKTVRPTLR